MGYIKYEKYGFVMLEESGKQVGAWLLSRHKTIEEFLGIIGVEEEKVLMETEKIEHMVSLETVKSIEGFINFMKRNPDILDRYNEHKGIQRNNPSS